jgi:Protein of unknown function (DUF1569)
MRDAKVDTRLVGNQRRVRLRTLDDLEAQVGSLTAADAAGKVRPLGNWSPAQVLWHLGRFMELSLDGFPLRYRPGPAWLLRLFRLVACRWLIALAFRPGFTNPREAATLEPDPFVSLTDAAACLRQQIGRIRGGERMTQSCAVEGPYSHKQLLYRACATPSCTWASWPSRRSERKHRPVGRDEIGLGRPDTDFVAAPADS